MPWERMHKDRRARIEFTSAEPERGVEYLLDLGDDLMAWQGAMLFTEDVAGTRLTWSQESKLDRAIGRFLGQYADAFIGKDFEKGLEILKTLCEGR